MATTRRRRLSAGIATLLLALLVLLPVAASPSVAEPHEPGDSLLTITSITTVADGEGRATVEGRLTNTGSSALTAPEVALVPQEAGSRRSDIGDWTAGDEPVSGTALATTTLEDIPVGQSAPFDMEVDSADLLPGASAGAAWVSVQSDSTAVHTFIGVHRTKEYVPLRVVWGIPLLLPTDRRLFATDVTNRSKAWDEAVGPDSRLAQLTAEAPARNEAWLLDPSLLTVPDTSDEPRTATDGFVSTAERDVRQERATALRDQLVGSRTLVLPDADADVAAGARSAQARRVVGPRVSSAVKTAQSLDARSNVLWPADGLATQDRAAGLERLAPGSPSTLLVPNSSLRQESFTPTGGARTTTGTQLVVSDGPLSELVEGLESPEDLVLARQQLVAETASVLRERSGTERTIVIVPDRDATPDPEAWADLRASTSEIPWLAEGALASVLDDARQAAPGRTPRSSAEIRTATKGDPAPSSVLTTASAQRILDNRAAMEIFASVRTDGVPWRREMLTSLHQQTSTRWRSNQQEFGAMQDELSDEVSLEHKDLVVSSGDINFFADTGRLQITIINNTDVELTNLVVRLTPGNHFLRMGSDPEPVNIGPGGRHTVTVNVSALAAGQVPVDVSVATPEGTQVAAPATLHVKVRPTGDSIYWIIGGAAGLLLAAGTWRSLRGGRRSPGTEVAHTKEN